jgi:uncharacterized RmlC-like cupin family protein
MAEKDWRTGVTVVRAGAIRGKRGADGTGRVTAFDFAGEGGSQRSARGGKETWIGTVVQPPGANTGPHHHGRHEVALYVVRGRSEIRWGERLEFAAAIGPGDFVYFAPFVPHQERNLDDGETVEFLVVRSDNAGIVVKLDGVPVEQPETVG